MSRRDVYNPVADEIPFDHPDFQSDNVKDAILEAKGIKTFPIALHFVKGNGLNLTMSNGSFFRVTPSTASSGSFSGYPAAFPFQTPFLCRLSSIVLTFRRANFDWNSTAGEIQFDIETRDHEYNGSSVLNRINVKFGNFSGNQTGTDTFRYELFSDSFSYVTGTEEIDYARLIGFRFVKSSSGSRAINSFVDLVMKLNFEEV